jgi:hypothetical protein
LRKLANGKGSRSNMAFRGESRRGAVGTTHAQGPQIGPAGTAIKKARSARVRKRTLRTIKAKPVLVVEVDAAIVAGTSVAVHEIKMTMRKKRSQTTKITADFGILACLILSKTASKLSTCAMSCMSFQFRFQNRSVDISARARKSLQDGNKK